MSPELVQMVRKKACNDCKNSASLGIRLRNPGEAQLSHLDSNQIGSWSIWQGSLTPKILVVGQDWSDLSYYRGDPGTNGPGGRDDDKNRTNKTLASFLGEILGRNINLPEDIFAKKKQPDPDLFFTNAILCVKEAYCDRTKGSCPKIPRGTGGLKLPVNDEWFEICGKRFLPRLILRGGNSNLSEESKAFFAKSTAFESMLEYLKPEYQEGISIGNSRLFLVWHCGSSRLCNQTNFKKKYGIVTQNIRQDWDWQRIKSYHQCL
jgi:DNA polymerase